MRSIASRNATLESVIRTGVSAGTKSLRCACPAIVQSWNADAQTITAQVAIKEVLNIEGVETETEIPLLVDVPVVMPRAGGFSLVFAPKQGDECLLVFSDMCIDSWWQSGGVQSQAERRRHDLSDAFAIMGCWSQQRKPAIPTEGCSLQNDEGTVAIALDSTGCHFKGFDVGVRDLDSNDYGVAVGESCEATAASKSFIVAESHKTYIKGMAQFTGGASFNGKTENDSAITLNGDIEFQTTLGTIKRVNNWRTLDKDSDDESDDESKAFKLLKATEANATDNPVRILDRFGFVQLAGEIFLNDSLSSKGEVQVLTIPEDYRPEYRVVLPVTVWRTKDYVYAFSATMFVETDGRVIIKNASSNTLFGGENVSIISLAGQWVLAR